MNSALAENLHAARTWFKSSYSSDAGGNCVEVARPAGAVLVRDTKCPGGPVLSAAPGAWAAFLRFADGTS
ncbi:protein of unknown function [Streptomyces sp. WMMB 714]|jgi:hypothetical protein|uniref:DUF397 domain-containing protein n=1 Tax=Streptomyces sp. WMMB 714 TaxID=1286822 RepID=UPI0005F7D106|nr:DUF397 domain-containing protein [Streptomyces sp. WMMB 714]SCK26790.1 protein of unknown function [Streptomyces sp. WMMB 714]